MKKRFWTGINKETNPLGFGCWQISGTHTQNNLPNGWGDITENQAIDLLCYAMENGIDFFDTAQGYNYGKSEQLLGEAIKESKKDIVICTKVSLTEEEIIDKKIGVNYKKRVVQSLENLKLPYIDILLIHNPPDDINWKEFNYDILDELANEKTIGTYGVSSKGLNGAINVIENNVGSTLEWVFNIFERRPIKDLFPIIERNKMNFIARSPLSRGLINPKYLKNEPFFDSNDFRSTLPQEWIDWAIGSLKIFQNNGISETEIIKKAVLFCLQFNQVNATILGIKSKDQLNEYLSIRNEIDFGFDFSLFENISEFYPKWA